MSVIRNRLLSSPFLWSGLISVLLATIGFSLSITNRWGALLPNAMWPFADLGVLTGASDCLLLAPTVPGDTCAWTSLPNGYPDYYNYPRFLYLTLAALGVGFESTWSLGLLFIALLSISVGLLTYLSLKGRPSLSKSVLIAFFALTPPFFLLMERGNSDTLAFFLFTIGVTLVSFRKTGFGAVVLSAAAVFKIFPFGAGLVILLPRERRTLHFYVFAFLAIAGVATYLPDLQLMLSRTPQSIGSAFGAAVLPYAISQFFFMFQLDPVVARLIGLLVFLVTTIFCFFLINKWGRNSGWSKDWFLMMDSLSRDAAAKYLFVSGAGSFGLAYLLGTSYDYRLIFLFPVALGLIRISNKDNLLVLVAIAMLASVFILANNDIVYSNIADVMLALVTPLMLLAVINQIFPGRPTLES